MPRELSLSELILDVANQLRLVQEQSNPQNDIMLFKECEMELQVQVASEGNAGVKFYIVNAGIKDAQSLTHTVKVKFVATDVLVTAADQPIDDSNDKSLSILRKPVRQKHG